MIFRDLRYIIKRILIGVGIALLLMLIKGNFLLRADALTIAVFDSDYNVVGYCSNCTDVQANTSSKLVTANRFVITFDNVNISTNQQYNVDVTFQQSATTRTTYVNRLLYVLHQNNNFLQTPTNPNLSVSNYADTLLPSNPPQPGVLTQASYSGTFTSDTTGVLRLDIEFQPQTFSYLRVLNNVITYMGTDNSQAINNSTENIVNNNNQNTTNIINNNNSNTQEIINNNNSNTQDIIDNQNSNTDKEIESQKVCREINIDKNSGIRNGYLGNSGNVGNSDNAVVTDFYDITNITDFIVLSPSVTSGQRYCFYDRDKSFISCHTTYGLESNSSLSIPNNAKFVRFTILIETNIPTFNLKFCKNGNQAINDTLNDDNVSSSIGSANNFFTNFNVNSHGISGIITSPLRLLQTFTTAICSPLTFQLPFLHDTVTLPCMKPIIENYFGLFFSLYQLITTGLISYHVLINIYSKIRDLQDPNKDRIEVLNL